MVPIDAVRSTFMLSADASASLQMVLATSSKQTLSPARDERGDGAASGLSCRLPCRRLAGAGILRLLPSRGVFGTCDDDGETKRYSTHTPCRQYIRTRHLEMLHLCQMLSAWVRAGVMTCTRSHRCQSHINCEIPAPPGKKLHFHEARSLAMLARTPSCDAHAGVHC